MSMKPILKVAVKFCQKNATKILAGGAVLSEFVGFWMMHKRAPIVHEKLKALPEDATTMDKVKVAAPLYLPAALMLATSSGCIIGGCALGEARLAAMTNLAMMSETALAKYEQKVIDTIGEDKAKELHEQAAKEISTQEQLPPATRVDSTGKGSDIFFEPLTGRYFLSCEKAIYDAEKAINNQIDQGSDMWASVSDWMFELGLSYAQLGEFSGWNIERRLNIGVSKEWENTPDGRPCKIISYYQLPVLLNGK